MNISLQTDSAGGPLVTCFVPPPVHSMETTGKEGRRVSRNLGNRFFKTPAAGATATATDDVPWNHSPTGVVSQHVSLAAKRRVYKPTRVSGTNEVICEVTKKRCAIDVTRGSLQPRCKPPIQNHLRSKKRVTTPRVVLPFQHSRSGSSAFERFQTFLAFFIHARYRSTVPPSTFLSVGTKRRGCHGQPRSRIVGHCSPYTLGKGRGRGEHSSSGGGRTLVSVVAIQRRE
jgi:hypothetical protein